MSDDNRRGFLKTLLKGGAVTATGTFVKADPPATPAPKPIVITKTVTVTEPFPQNISGEEMAIWLVITAKRREDKAREKRRIEHGGDPWRD